MSIILGLFYISFIFQSCSEENPVPIIDDNDGDVCYPELVEGFQACLQPKDSNTLEIATWNIRQFPNTTNTIAALEDIITNFHADVIAVQEITSAEEFNNLDELLPNWTADLDASSGLNVGYLYNTCEIVSVEGFQPLEIEKENEFPRAPVEVKITHQNGLEVTLINIHLKCCGDVGSIDYKRRELASQSLKEYTDANHPDNNFILLGDFNDEIDDSESPFLNFIEDDLNYRFADMSIALGPTTSWSFPGWPSHIDHILISNELYDNVDYVETIDLKDCVDKYANIVSDHRPVLISLTKDN